MKINRPKKTSNRKIWYHHLSSESTSSLPEVGTVQITRVQLRIREKDITNHILLKIVWMYIGYDSEGLFFIFHDAYVNYNANKNSATPRFRIDLHTHRPATHSNIGNSNEEV